jgi:hypothetical protein
MLRTLTRQTLGKYHEIARLRAEIRMLRELLQETRDLLDLIIQEAQASPAASNHPRSAGGQCSR